MQPKQNYANKLHNIKSLLIPLGRWFNKRYQSYVGVSRVNEIDGILVWQISFIECDFLWVLLHTGGLGRIDEKKQDFLQFLQMNIQRVSNILWIIKDS